MPHSLTLISTIAAGLAVALVFGFLAVRIGLPALVGYLVAGIAIGPHSPGYVADVGVAGQLSEIGIMLLMFGVGLHFSLKDLLSVKGIALPGALVQIAVATAIGIGMTRFWGWSLGEGLVFGLSLSVASTVVLLKALEARGLIGTLNGRIAVGWLVVEDLAMVLVLVLLPLASPLLGGRMGTHAGPAHGFLTTLAITLGKVSLFVALTLGVGRRLFPWILWQVAKTGSRELFTLCVIVAAVAFAYGSAELFGVSMALGAFFAGMVLQESDLSLRAAEESLPFRDAFSVLFFVSVGMLFDPRVLLEHPLKVLGVLAVIVLGKSLAAFALVLLLRYPLNTALTVSASLAQIGEFSFILAGLGMSLGLLSQDGYSLILAGSLLSIALNPLLFQAIEPSQRWLRKRSGLARGFQTRTDPLAALPASVEPAHVTGHVILVGYGRVGQRIGEDLAAAGIPFVVAEQDRGIVESLRARGIKAVFGEASDPSVLIQAHIARARILVIAVPDTLQVLKMLESARALNPGADTIVRTHSDEQAELLRKEKAGKVFMGERELARSISRYVTETLAKGEI
ncbi:MAG: sodium:proton antiporter [Fibrobacteres bacterium]|nr:sodium:proton antiporter [Fibrobacterota bacterium]